MMKKNKEVLTFFTATLAYQFASFVVFFCNIIILNIEHPALLCLYNICK
jgi:hypothetical protein